MGKKAPHGEQISVQKLEQLLEMYERGVVRSVLIPYENAPSQKDKRGILWRFVKQMEPLTARN